MSWRERRALSLKLWLFGPAILIVVTFNAVILGLVWEQHSGYRQLRQIITDQHAIQAQLESIAQNRSTQQQECQPGSHHTSYHQPNISLCQMEFTN